MTALELVAVTPAGTPLPPSFEAVRDDRHAVVLAPRPDAAPVSALFASAVRRRAFAAALVTRQRRLEALLAAGDVLPALPGLPMDHATARAALATGRSGFAEGLDRLAGRVQMQVEIAAPAGVEGLRRVADAARAALAGIAEDSITLPHDAPGILLNAALLLRRDRLAAFETALEALDAEHGGALRIRLVGPAPATAFVALDLARPTAADLSGAAAALDLSRERDPDAGAIDAAHRRIARAAHPDAGGAPGADLARLGEARSLLRAVAEARRALAKAGLSDERRPPLARLVRDGREPIRTPAAPAGVAA